jgi:hypothetical protein
MKRVVWIERQSKRSNGRVSAQGTVVMSEKIGSTVALIQALIPIRPHAVDDTLKAEVVGFF